MSFLPKHPAPLPTVCLAKFPSTGHPSYLLKCCDHSDHRDYFLHRLSSSLGLYHLLWAPEISQDLPILYCLINGSPLQYSCLENPMEEPSGLLSIGSHRVRHDWGNLACIGGGNGNPLQYSCLENPRDRGAWWAAVYGVTQSQTWLKRCSSSSSIVFSFCHITYQLYWVLCERRNQESCVNPPLIFLIESQCAVGT